MPLKLKSFSQPDQLKRFQPEILLRLLEPFRLFFTMRGFSLPSPDGGEVDLPTLAGILAEPDEEMPSELVEALHLIEHLGTPEYYDDLLQLAAENGIDPDGEATAPDLAVQVWLKNPQALERKDREGLFQKRKSFDSFRTADSATIIEIDAIPSDLGPLEEALGRYFFEKKRGIGCRVIRKDSPGEVRFLVQHGQPCKRETAGLGNQIRHPRYHEGEDDETQAFVAFRTLTDDSRVLDLLSRYEARFERQFRATLIAFLNLRAKRRAEERTNPPESDPPASGRRNLRLYWVDEEGNKTLQADSWLDPEPKPERKPAASGSFRNPQSHRLRIVPKRPRHAKPAPEPNRLTRARAIY